MKKITIICGHPNYDNSIANKGIIERVMKEIPNISLRILQKIYPNFNINVEEEQKNLIESDIVVLQYPMEWYSVPGILKEWFDRVLLYGFAYGENGDKLKNKILIPSITVGGQMQSYKEMGVNTLTLEPLTKPLLQTAIFTGMSFINPVFTYGNVYIPNVFNTVENVQKNAVEQANELIRVLNVLDKED